MMRGGGVFLLSTSLQVLTLLSTANAMSRPTLVGTSECTPIPQTKFPIYSGNPQISNVAESNGGMMSVEEVYPPGEFKVVIFGFYYAD